MITAPPAQLTLARTTSSIWRSGTTKRTSKRPEARGASRPPKGPRARLGKASNRPQSRNPTVPDDELQRQKPMPHHRPSTPCTGKLHKAPTSGSAARAEATSFPATRARQPTTSSVHSPPAQRPHARPLCADCSLKNALRGVGFPTQQSAQRPGERRYVRSGQGPKAHLAPEDLMDGS